MAENCNAGTAWQSDVCMQTYAHLLACAQNGRNIVAEKVNPLLILRSRKQIVIAERVRDAEKPAAKLARLGVAHQHRPHDVVLALVLVVLVLLGLAGLAGRLLLALGGLLRRHGRHVARHVQVRGRRLNVAINVRIEISSSTTRGR